MSFQRVLQELIRSEVHAAIAPLANAVNQLQNNDIGSQIAALLSGGALKRGPGRPRKNFALGRKPSKRGPKAKLAKGGVRPCAIVGCKRAYRSKGYCSSHYQKYRMLERTKRLPSDWVMDAKPHTVKDLVLPRGRAGAKALAAAKRK